MNKNHFWAILAIVIIATLYAGFVRSQNPMGGMGYPPNAPDLVGTTANIGGSLLVLGGCTTGTATVAGATTSMVAVTSPQTALANGVQWQAAVTSANTVTVQECALLTVTPTSTPFNVRVIQ